MKLKQNISNALRIASFVAACCVVMIHANSVHVVANPAGWNVKLHTFFCQTLTCWAVPYFFACSGFFFALGAYARHDGGGYGQLVAKKIRGLLVPYLLWAIIATVFALPLIMINNHLTGHPLTERTVLATNNIWDFINRTFGILCTSPKHLGVLWFVRALFVLFLFAPVWRIFTSRKLAWLLPILWFCTWRFATDINFAGFALPIKTPSFFFLGMAIAVYVGKRVEREDRFEKFERFEKCEKCGGVESVEKVEKVEKQKKLPNFLNYSFWIYCTHNIILGYMLAAGHFIFGKTDVAVLLLTLISIPLAISMSLIFAGIIRNRFPQTFQLLNGGR